MARKKQLSPLRVVPHVGRKFKAVKDNLNKPFLQEIRHLTVNSGLLVAKAPFVRVVRGILEEMHANHKFRLSVAALDALQCVGEAYIIGYFEAALQCALHAKRVTVNHKDMRLVKWFHHHLRSKDDAYSRTQNDEVKHGDEENVVLPWKDRRGY